MAGATQPPWLHQFRLGWTQVHPNYWIYCKHWGWVNSFFSPSLTSRLPIKPQLPTSTPSKTLNLVVTQKQNQCYKRRCYRNNVKVMLQKTMLHRCVEAMLQKRCWNDVVKDVKVVLYTFLFQKITSAKWHTPKFLVRPKKGPTMLKSESSWNLVSLPASNTKGGVRGACWKLWD